MIRHEHAQFDRQEKTQAPNFGDFDKDNRRKAKGPKTKCRELTLNCPEQTENWTIDFLELKSQRDSNFIFWFVCLLVCFVTFMLFLK